MDALDAIPRWAFELGFVVYVLSVSGFVLLERRRSTATLALLLSLVFIPLLGFAVYWVFGRQRIKRRQKKRERREIDPLDGTRDMARLSAASLPGQLDQNARGLVKLALATTDSPLRRADRVALLPTASEAWDSLLQAIDGAKRCVHLEFYIWRDDETGRALVKRLTERAAEGIDVRVLYDDLGSLGLPGDHFESLREAGGQVAAFAPLRIPFTLRRSRVNLRNHRKIMVIDCDVGFVGGLNMGDEYFGARSLELGWRDLLMRLEGDAVLGLQATFLDDWLKTTGKVVDLDGNEPAAAVGIDGRQPATPRPWQATHPGPEAMRAANPFTGRPARPVASDGPLLQIIPSGPDLPIPSAIASQFTAAVGAARHRVAIATPYFVPDEPLALLLRTAALKGVDVKIIVPSPGNNDSRLVAWAARAFYSDLLGAGCRIFHYQRGMLHAKYMVVDDVGALGSANMDARSFHINYEITAMIYNAEVSRRLMDVFEHDLAGSTEVLAEAWAKRGRLSRLVENLAYVLSPVL